MSKGQAKNVWGAEGEGAECGASTMEKGVSPLVVVPPIGLPPLAQHWGRTLIGSQGAEAQGPDPGGPVALCAGAAAPAGP